MARILATEIAPPAHVSSQDEISAEIRRWLGNRISNVSKILDIFSRSGVERRYTVIPRDEIFARRSFDERNRIYCEASVDLSLKCARAVLELADVDAREIGLVTTVSCTGFMIPSVDAHLANLLPLSRDIRRLPITELGCAAGAMALSRTADYLTARPRECALVISVEFPSLCFQPDDYSMAHIVSCALFGDGAAAVILAGEDSGVRSHPGAPRIVATQTRFFYDTLDYMGFQLRSSGFHMVLDPGIPQLVEEQVAPVVHEFLETRGLQLSDIDHFLVHPGGRRIIDTVEKALDRGPDALRFSRRVLADHANLSSATILYMLRDFTNADVARPGDRALLMAFGPGFNAEMVLLEWPG